MTYIFNTRSRIESAGRRALARVESPTAPHELKMNWVQLPAMPEVWTGRVIRFRTEVVPWLAATRPLNGARILEVGCGEGASTVAMAEQSAIVSGFDLDSLDLDVARTVLAGAGLNATLIQGNGAEIESKFEKGDFNWIIFWAVLEHMTIPERLETLRQAWSILEPGGLLTVVETPNRLWPHDSHTSNLPFFSWLPQDLAFSYSRFSKREGFGDRYLEESAEEVIHFLRRGLGVSYHEFDLAIGSHEDLKIVSFLQGFRRERSVLRRLGWRFSHAGKTERLLMSYLPQNHAAWFQPFLYLTISK